MVCAAGAIYSDDPSHMDDCDTNFGIAEEPPWRPAGWKWARQVDPLQNALSHTSSVYDLQLYVVRFFEYRVIVNPFLIGRCS